MEIVQAYQVVVSDYSRLRRAWNHHSVYYSTEITAATYFETVSTNEYRRKELKSVQLLKTDKGFFPLPNPVALIQ